MTVGSRRGLGAVRPEAPRSGPSRDGIASWAIRSVTRMYSFGQQPVVKRDRWSGLRDVSFTPVGGSSWTSQRTSRITDAQRSASASSVVGRSRVKRTGMASEGIARNPSEWCAGASGAFLAVTVRTLDWSHPTTSPASPGAAARVRVRHDCETGRRRRGGLTLATTDHVSSAVDLSVVPSGGPSARWAERAVTARSLRPQVPSQSCPPARANCRHGCTAPYGHSLPKGHEAGHFEQKGPRPSPDEPGSGPGVHGHRQGERRSGMENRPPGPARERGGHPARLIPASTHPAPRNARVAIAPAAAVSAVYRTSCRPVRGAVWSARLAGEHSVTRISWEPVVAPEPERRTPGRRSDGRPALCPVPRGSGRTARRPDRSHDQSSRNLGAQAFMSEGPLMPSYRKIDADVMTRPAKRANRGRPISPEQEALVRAHADHHRRVRRLRGHAGTRREARDAAPAAPARGQARRGRDRGEEVAERLLLRAHDAGAAEQPGTEEGGVARKVALEE